MPFHRKHYYCFIKDCLLWVVFMFSLDIYAVLYYNILYNGVNLKKGSNLDEKNQNYLYNGAFLQRPRDS